MILFFIWVGLIVIGVALFFLAELDIVSCDAYDVIKIIGGAIAAIGILALGFSAGPIIDVHCHVPLKIEQQNIVYETLCKEYEDLKTSDLNDSVRLQYTEVMSQICNWNQKTAEMKHYAYSPWVSFYYNKEIAEARKFITITEE